jgi:hypothetical protein
MPLFAKGIDDNNTCPFMLYQIISEWRRENSLPGSDEVILLSISKELLTNEVLSPQFSSDRRNGNSRIGAACFWR